MAEPKLSPMMQQYKKIKDEHQDAILMYRLGDFYEMFFDDAITASAELNITLTGRNCGLEERAPMCGVPYHSADPYIVKLVKRGHRVAICEQVEDPAESKGIVKREITRVYTPGTLDIIDSENEDSNIYTASVCIDNETVSLAISDITTGELKAFEFTDSYSRQNLISELSAHEVRELIIQNKDYILIEDLLNSAFINPYIDILDESYYSFRYCKEYLLKHFETSSLIPLDLEGRDNLISAIGALLMYLSETQKTDPAQIRKLDIKSSDEKMRLDRNTIRNLELTEAIYDKESKASLLGILDKTKTAMGGRLIKSWIKEPLLDPIMINKRQESVEELGNDAINLNNIRSSLANIYDLQRLATRIICQRADAADLIALKKSILSISDVKQFLDYFDSALIKEINQNISYFDEVYTMIEKAIKDDPSLSLNDGGIIKAGYSPDIDNLKESISEAKVWIANLENSEKERTGIKTLKVGYNQVFGYYIDVSKGMSDKVPAEYIRKQTLVNSERYITPELKEKEDIVLSAEAKINKMELEEFKLLRNDLVSYVDELQKSSQAIASLDVLVSFARVSIDNNYTRPIVNDGYIINIESGRHPVVERLLGAGMFVSNDTYIDAHDKSMLIITGPNMSGKSTYMRQTAVIVLMAQIGCFVPAKAATIGICDRIFTRIGASDNLAFGQSTFYIEMSELAGILRNSTSRSLILLDEIGRGTSTFDGLSIAWATAAYLCEEGHKARTMFATHYHELTELESHISGISNLSVAVAEEGDNIVFLHNIIKGSASKSYGIHVARIAGVPGRVRDMASKKLEELESSSYTNKDVSSNNSINSDMINDPKSDERMTRNEPYNYVLNEIRSLDVDNMTPMQAINFLQQLIKNIDEECDD